jgi:hypothetical protein
MSSEPSPIVVREGAGSCAGLDGHHGLQERRRGYEEEIAGDGAAEVQQPVVIVRRPADKHAFKHLLEGPGRAAVADKVGTKIALRRVAATESLRAHAGISTYKTRISKRSPMRVGSVSQLRRIYDAFTSVVSRRRNLSVSVNDT